MSSSDLKEALTECVLYNKLGGLDEKTMRDIAHNYSVSYELLKTEWGKDDRQRN
jgi:hypothetical protein